MRYKQIEKKRIKRHKGQIEDIIYIKLKSKNEKRNRMGWMTYLKRYTLKFPKLMKRH